MTQTWKHRLPAAACALLALSFAFGGLAKFLPGDSFFGPPYSEKFVDWGYPSWFRIVVGSGELVAAALLLVPRRRFLGAATLVVILTGAVLTHIANLDPLAESVAAPICLAFASAVAWATRPADLRRLLAA